MSDLLRRLVETGQDPVWTTDTSGSLLWFNPATAALWEALQRPAPTLGAELYDAPSSAGEWSPSGEERTFDVRFQPEGPQIAWSMREVTDHHRLERELAAARKQVERAEAARSDFLAKIGHELRTPLNAIVGLTEGNDGIARKVNRNARALLSLLSALLDFARIEAGLLVLQPQTCDPSTVVGEGVEMHRVAATERGLQLTTTIEDSVPELVHVDAERLRQIVVNLVSNAVQFTLVGSIQVTVRALDATPPLLEISVADTGLGMSRREQKLIFTRFYRAQRSVSERSPGTGLGLAICKALVERMDGTIAVRSAPGKGSVFRVRVPLEAAIPEPVGPRLTRPLNVLAVDDVDDNLRVTERILSGRGDRATLVTSGHQALDAMAGDTFDVVLMDVDMHPMDGVRATVEIREREALLGSRRVPIVALTAHDVPAVRVRCTASGMDGFVTKPVDPAVLSAAIDKVVDRSLRVLVADAQNDRRERLSDQLIELGAVVLAADTGAELLARLDGFGVDIVLVGDLDLAPDELDRATQSRGYTGRFFGMTGTAAAPTWERIDPDDPSTLDALSSAPTSERTFDPDIADLIPQYLADRRVDFEELTAWIEADDGAAVARRAHQIKGSGTSYGFPDLTALASQLEQVALDGDLQAAKPILATMVDIVG